MADLGIDLNERNHFSCIWTIDNAWENCVVFTPAFTVQGTEITKWYIQVTFGFAGFIKLKLWRKKAPGPDSIDAKFEFSVLGIDGNPLIKKVGEKKFLKGDSFAFDEFANQRKVFVQERADFLPRDTFSIRCRLWIAEIPKPEFCFARTILRMDRGSFIWTVKEFSTLQVDQKRKTFLNPTAKEEMQLMLCLFIKEQDDDDQYLCLKMLNSDKKRFNWFKIEIQLVDKQGEIIHTVQKIGYGADHLNFEDFFDKRKLMEDKASLLPHDVLTLKCEFELVAEIWNRIENYSNSNSSEIEKTTLKVGKMNIGEENETSAFIIDIKGLLEAGSLSDISLQAGSRSFPAHKCILSARSPVFKAMFSGDMKEKTSEYVEIPDLEEDTLGELLSYIYTDRVGELQWQDAANLYRAADKYELLDLKGRCSAILKSNVSASNVCSLLVMSDMHHDRELLEAAHRFMIHLDADFFVTDTWQSFKEENSKLALEILERIVCSIKLYF